MSSIRLISAAFLLAAAAAPFACTIEKAPPAAPPPAPAAPPPAAATGGQEISHLPCAPIGVWKVGGATGTQSIKVTAASKPGAYDVWYNGTQAAAPGQVQNNHFQFDTGAPTGGLASCDLAADCKTMNCGFKGGQPVVFNKTE